MDFFLLSVILSLAKRALALLSYWQEDPAIGDQLGKYTSDDISPQSWRGVNNSDMSQGPRVGESDSIVEGTGWSEHPDGTIELVARIPDAIGPGLKSVSCQNISDGD